MLVALVSTYPPQHCGIAAYTFALAEALKQCGAKPLVLGEEGSEPTDGIACEPVFRRGGAYAGRLLEAVCRHVPDVVHVQHSPDIFGLSAEFLTFLEGCRKVGVPSVVTMHTVYNFFSGLVERKPQAPFFHRRLGCVADMIIVHQENMAETLIRHGVERERVVVVPHGTPPIVQRDGSGIRKKLSIPERAFLLLFIGFVHVQKNIVVLIRMMPPLLEAVPDAVLVIAGEVAGNLWYNRLYLAAMKGLARTLGVSDQILFIQKFMPLSEMEELYAAADVVLLPHYQGYGSASGVSRQALAALRPVVCSDVPKFEDIKRCVSSEIVVPPGDPRRWAETVSRLLMDADFRDRIVRREKECAAAWSWLAVAKTHLNIYGALSRQHQGSGASI